MKRSLSEISTRATAGCLSVPLFNQKKRNRLPLTSNPNECNLSSNNAQYSSQKFEVSVQTSEGTTGFSQNKVTSDFRVEQKSTIKNQSGCPSSSLSSNATRNKMTPLSYPGHLNSRSQVQQNVNTSMWKKTDSPSLSSSKKNDVSCRETIHRQSTHVSTSSQCREPAPHMSQAGTQGQRYRFTLQRSKSFASDTASKGLKLQNASWQRQPFAQQNNFCGKNSACLPNTVVIQKPPAFPVQQVEKDHSLRILSAAVNGMKHWSQYSCRTPLLFEVIAMLDSAVTNGAHGAKTFLLRSGKDTVQCIFYETDRDLPRLIRGQIHRCVGSYDKERYLFKCVSVRPASTAEKAVFQRFIAATDAEMRNYVKGLSEI
ncbi:spermatogenesis-associated protein 22 [Protopterus annectens]|uniref:spermatogenesis-associated protein 22 n=1 Tax=Protopterus annectens TaxID=7888 RepID=UPI001CFC383C|nr:spermatogenesis-associated protein 22 [Protopterus annectens]